MPNFVLFVFAVLEHWEYLAFGIGGVVALLLSKMKWSFIPNWAIWAFVGACLFIACFQAWQIEHTQVVALEEFSRPRLRLVVHGIGHEQRPNRRVDVLVMASVTNQGRAPSTCGDYILRVRTPDGSQYNRNNVYFDAGLWAAVSNDEIRIGIEDDLYAKTGSNPIVQGQTIYGYLAFEVGLIDPAILPDSRLDVSCADIFGIRSAYPGRLGAEVDQIGRFPGITYLPIE